MAEKGSAFNKILILIVLGGAAYIYYDKQIRTPKVEGVLIDTNDNSSSENTFTQSPVDNKMEAGDYKGVIETLATKTDLTPEQKFQLATAYKETSQATSAQAILEGLIADKTLPMGNKADANALYTSIMLESDEKKALTTWGNFIKELDPSQLPVIDLELGDKMWQKYGSKVNTNWYELYYAYGLAYNGLLEDNPRFKEVEARLQKLSTYLFFSASDIPNLKSYTIQSGDRIINIAKQFNITKDLLEISNGLTATSVIREGNRLKIVEGVGTVKVNKEKYTLLLYLNGIFLKRYRIGLGKENKTPEGIFKVNAAGKMTRPPWYNRQTGVELAYTDGGANGNPLGTHWIPFSEGDGVGIHGTWEPNSIGKNESNGCVRMLNNEVKEVYAFMKEGSTVEIE